MTSILWIARDNTVDLYVKPQDSVHKERNMDLGLKNKIALITGGSVGIGLAVAEALAAEGVQVILCARDLERLEREASRIQTKYNVSARGIRADVSKAGDIKSLVDTISRDYKGLDILINNAGTGSEETIMDASDEKWQYYWDLHVMASIRLAKAAVPLLKKRGGGVILHNASICAAQPLWYEPIYNTTKAALVMFSKCLANELIKDNIRVNTINPGLVLTPDWNKTAEKLTKNTDSTAEEYLENIAKKNAPIGRFASPEELAHFFVFLCSPKASYSVGSTYYVDGGWLNVIG